jgi:hypothetical protein
MVFGQSVTDIGKISLTSYLPDNTKNLPINARELLLSKLNQITTQNGLGADGINKRFILTATINPITKDIISGPPQQVAQNIEITLLIGDAIEGKKFETLTFSLKGVGINEDKATIDAIAKIKSSAENIASFVSKGKQKMLDYYNSNCNSIKQQAEALASQKKYNEAIALLIDVPDVVGDCYSSCLKLATTIFNQQQEATCKQLLFEAQNLWAAQQDLTTAVNILTKLALVNQQAQCSKEVANFMETIKNKLLADEKAKLQQELKRYEDEKTYKQEELKAMKEIALEYLKNQPKTISNNYLLIR